jgi:hypothetical protein
VGRLFETVQRLAETEDLVGGYRTALRRLNEQLTVDVSVEERSYNIDLVAFEVEVVDD